jgi:xylose isomerase
MHEYNHQAFIATRFPQRNGLESVFKLEIKPNHQTTKRKYENKVSLIQ